MGKFIRSLAEFLLAVIIVVGTAFVMASIGVVTVVIYMELGTFIGILVTLMLLITLTFFIENLRE